MDEEDSILPLLKQMLFEKDRAFILGALRTLSKLCMNEHNEAAFSTVDPHLIQRLMQLLYVWDEEMVTAVTDLLYHYTGMFGSVPIQIATAMKRGTAVSMLLKFLEWRNPATARLVPGGVISPEQLQKVQQVQNSQSNAVEFCVNWWKKYFMVDPSSKINHVGAFQKYSIDCQAAKLAVLPGAEFGRCISMAFPGARFANTQSVMNGKNILWLNGVRIKPFPPPQAQPVNTSSSSAPNSAAPPANDANASVEPEEQADKHESKSRTESLNGDDEQDESAKQPEEHEAMQVETPNEDRDEAQQEQQQSNEDSMEVEEEDKQHQQANEEEDKNDDAEKEDTNEEKSQEETGDDQKDANGNKQELNPDAKAPTDPKKVQKLPVPLAQLNDPSKQLPQPNPNAPPNFVDTSSIPLTAALILRNLSRAKANRDMFIPYERDIIRFLTSRVTHDSVVKALSTVLLEINREEEPLL